MSRMLRALSLLGAGMGGYAVGQREHAAEERRKEEQDWQREDRTYMRRQREDADRLRDDLRTAGQSPAIESGEVYQPSVDDEGNPMPVNPTAGTFKVGGQRYADRASAERAANDPMARMRRMSDVYMAHGQPERASAIESTSIQGEAARAQLRALKLKEADDAFNRDLLTRATDFDSLGQFITDSAADDVGGKAKVKFAPSADGKQMVLHKVNADGTTTPTQTMFTNDADGLGRAVGMIGMRMAPEQKLAHMLAAAKTDEERKRWSLDFGLREREAGRKEAHDKATEKYQQGMLGVAQQNANTNEAYRRDMADAATTRANAAAGGAAQVSIKDLRDFDKDVNARVTEIFQPKEGMTPEERKELGVQRDATVAQANGIFQANAVRGMPLTAGTVLQAIQQAKDPANRRRLQANDGNVYEAVVVNGQPVIISAPMRPKAPAGPQPARDEWIRSAPPGTAVRPGAAGPSAAPAAAEGPGLMQRLAGNPIVQRMADLGVDYTSPEGKAMLKQRVAQAQAGGQPLSEVETLRAQQAGLL